MRKTCRLCGAILASLAIFAAAAVVIGDRALQAGPPAKPPVSKIAPVGDLLQQVDFFLERTAASLAEPLDFDQAKQSRAFKDANTLAALGLLLANHDQDFPEKASMAALVQHAQALAQAGPDADAARRALAGLQAARAGKAPAGPELAWGKVASLKALMKQVPLVHTGLKRGVDPSRLARQKTQTAGQSATLVAIAQASLLDTAWIKSPEDVAVWTKFCEQMRDAAGEVNAGVHAQDQPRVAGGMKQLAQSCDDCHAKFRQH
jgi:cytochrome c556